MLGELKDKNKIQSNYQPPEGVRLLTHKVREDYRNGYEIMHRSYREFNDKSVLTRMDLDQKAFNSYVDPQSSDPDESWRYNGVRPMTRNKIISIAAHVTASLIYPNVFAQDSNSKEDRVAAQVMKDLVEWNIRNSDYESTFLFGVISALTNPAVIFEQRFIEAMQTVKFKLEDGSYTTKDLIDDIESGFNTFVVPVDELFIGNVYEYNIQKQPYLIRRRYISFEEANSRYGDHDHFKYVKPGVLSLYSEDDDTFYDVRDDEMDDSLIEEAIYYNRYEDVQISFLNGIYFGEDNIDGNPMLHRDEYNRPKYPYAKSGYEPIDEKRFFYYKSAAFKLANEQDVLDRMWRMAMDGTFLSVMPPVAVSGDETVNSSVMFPGMVSGFAKDTKVNPMRISETNSAFNAISAIEQSANEASQDPIRQGVAAPGQQTAYEVSRIEQNARIQLGLFGKMIGVLVKDVGGLMVDDIIHHQTVGQVGEVDTSMEYQSFLLPNQQIAGKEVTKAIIFTDRFFLKDPTIEDSFDLLKQEGGLQGDAKIYLVNPLKFAKLKYQIYVDPDVLMPKNEAFEKAMNLEAYDRMIRDPHTDKRAVSQDFLVETFAKGKSDKYMMSSEQLLGMDLNAPEGEAEGSDLVNQATNTNSLRSLVSQ
jgi:hypothetical protein